MNESGLPPHFFLNSVEVVAYYLLSKFIFLKLKFLEVVTQINYYEESRYAFYLMIATPFLLAVIHLIFIFYKNKILNFKYLILSYFIIFAAWITAASIVLQNLRIEFGTEHFFFNYFLYIFGLIMIYMLIDFTHKQLNNFITKKKRTNGGDL